MSTAKTEDLPLWVKDRDEVIAQSVDASWRYGVPPDYSESKAGLAAESIYNHPEGSLEDLVQNLVRTFEMEVSFKNNPQEWLSVVSDKFRMSSNGGKDFTAEDVSAQGTYNLFMGDSQDYKASEESFESSGKLFRTAFPKGFLWEVLEVYSTPPNVTFKWRHWGTFTGKYKDYSPTGEVVEIIGMSLARVTEDLKIIRVEHYFDNTQFLVNLAANGKSTQDKKDNKQEKSIWQIFRQFFRPFFKGKEQPDVVDGVGEGKISACPFGF
ncbi:MAG: ester cyclase [Cyanobacteria bacterium P01_A01_bin.84]